MISVLLVDDQDLVRLGLRALLENEGGFTVAGEAADGLAAVEVASRTRPDVVLMDIRMPGIDGLEATRRIIANPDLAETKVIVLTTFERDEYVFDALRLGASGFLLKDTPPEQLVSAIHVIAEGDALLSPSITKRVISEFVRGAGPKPANQFPRLDELTARELEVLKLIARGLSNAEIAKELFVSETTVKTHVARVLMKLGLRDRVQGVVLAYESGLVEPGES
jgi:DNA-binding NarL/FixJ family response regulator